MNQNQSDRSLSDVEILNAKDVSALAEALVRRFRITEEGVLELASLTGYDNFQRRLEQASKHRHNVGEIDNFAQAVNQQLTLLFSS